MNSSIQCGLKGSYKVDLYSGGGTNRKLVESTEWFDNDITCSGLNYPFVYAFAECFRFLSLGTGATWGSSALSGNQVRTGLRNPLTGFQVYDAFNGYTGQSGQYIGWQGYEIGGPHDSSFSYAQSSSCGSKFTDNGINLYRGWTLPTGAVENGTVCNEPNGITITSFMVSPGSGTDVTGKGAFSIADRTVMIPSGFTATIFYQLSLNFLNFKNRTFFSGKNNDPNGWFDTGQAYTGVNNSELGLLSGWSNLSGVYRQVLPGLQMIDALGACITPVWGDQMEPKYKHCKKLFFYLSPDNAQFAVNTTGIGNLDESGAYNSDGLMANYMQFAAGGGVIQGTAENQWPSEPDKWFYSGLSQSSTNVVSVSIPANIRIDELLSIKDYSIFLDPSIYTYQTKGFVSPIQSNWPVSFATPGYLGISTNYPNYGQRVIYSTYLRTLPNSGLSTSTGSPSVPNRVNKVSRTAFFSPINSMGTNSRYSSLVLGYLASPGDIGELSFQPYIDFLFFDSSGRAANMPHYRLIPELYLTERGSGVSQIQFDITGAGGSIPTCVTRLYGAKGFMGPGVAPNPSSPMGLDLTHPLFTQNINVNSTYKSSGYSFSGQIIDTSSSGDYTYNGDRGWGSVYGVIASSGFYTSLVDTCLIDNTGWYGTQFSGFSGDLGLSSYPNPTGDYNKLFWPTRGNSIGVRITGLAYFLSGYGDFYDTTDYYSSGVFQTMNDIVYDTDNYGRVSLMNLVNSDGSPSFFLYDYPNTRRVSPDASSDAVTLNPNIQFKSGSNAFILPLKTGLYPDGGYHYFFFSGFNQSNLSTSRGTGKEYYRSSIPSFTWSGSNTIVGSSLTSTGIVLAYSPYLGATLEPLINTGKFLSISTVWKKPTGIIHHVESYQNSGRRLLPNYALPNNQNVNSYTPVIGGSYPGLSMENGLQVFCDFIWSGG